jgi:prenyltransferase beta subunit
MNHHDVEQTEFDLAQKIRENSWKFLIYCTVVSALQREDGSFAGDKWGEIDTRLVVDPLHLRITKFPEKFWREN